MSDSMGLFQTSTTVRVLLLTSQGLRAFTWQDSVLIPSGQFAADEQGQDEFNRYLSSPPDSPLYLVADVIEEDFRLENVAHVLGKDRSALLERKLAQFFRTTEYRSARVQGREESGRRDDQVLFSALTNNEQIGLWVKLILAQKAPLQGVLSIPWLMELFAGFQHLDQVPHLLLVNLEQQGGLRQTYIQAGRLKFSRMTSLATVRTSNLAETIVGECSHTRQYLERLKLLPRDQPLDIHLAVQAEIGEEIGEGLENSALFRFHFHETGIVAAELGIDPVLEDGQGVVFLALMQALRNKGLFNIYASRSVTRYYLLRQIRRWLIVGTSLFFVVALVIGFSLLADGFKQRGEQKRLNREAKQFEQQYQALQQNLPESPLPAKTMQNVVESVEKIQRQAASPMEMMDLVSRALGRCSDIRLQKLDWKLVVSTSDSEEGAEGTAVAAQPVVSGEVAAPALLLGMLGGNTQATTILEGTVYPGGGYLNAQQSVIRFITALEQIPGMKATPLVMPTASSPDSSMKATLDGEAIQAVFSLQLAYQGRQ
ncbi:MAG: hypothetical protein KJ900_10360 [Proteobacteria bacterium]|nr:hypothetical protein [Desulfocapsa sp.]MBU4043279.1 hypothetical protein [Pseudomonadota bacterium]